MYVTDRKKLLFYKVLLLLLVTLVLFYDPVSGMNSHTVFLPCPSLSVYVKMKECYLTIRDRQVLLAWLWLL